MKQNGNILAKGCDKIDLNDFKSYLSLAPIKKLEHSNELLQNEESKIKLIADHFKQIMILLGLDLSDDSLRDTPTRVAKMYVNEIFSGLDIKNRPSITLFENKYDYKEMLVEKDITLYTYCEHHFVPIIGKVHVAYYSNGKVIGLSKINRIVEYFSKRPQVQERLTNQIAEELKDILLTNDVAVLIDAVHFCVASRGVKDTNSSTITAYYGGKFLQPEVKREFQTMIA